MHRNAKRQKRSGSARIEETIRAASLIQKALSTGRSIYLEMGAISSLVGGNIGSRTHSLRLQLKDPEISGLLSEISALAGKGYTSILTPNGIVKVGELEGLVEVDSDTATCLDIMLSKLAEDKKQKKPQRRLSAEDVKILKDLLSEKRKLIGSFRA